MPQSVETTYHISWDEGKSFRMRPDVPSFALYCFVLLLEHQPQLIPPSWAFFLRPSLRRCLSCSLLPDLWPSRSRIATKEPRPRRTHCQPAILNQPSRTHIHRQCDVSSNRIIAITRGRVGLWLERTAITASRFRFSLLILARTCSKLYNTKIDHVSTLRSACGSARRFGKSIRQEPGQEGPTCRTIAISPISASLCNSK